jgi:predicted DsbA family dithiol-disulfide isomerase
MKIEIWTDVYCPWCYIGKRRFEKALQQFEHADQVEIIWRSYQLDPNAPRQFEGTINDYLAAHKGISRDQAEAMHTKLTAMAAVDGLDYRFDLAQVGNSFDAHRLIHLAAKHKLAYETQERLMQAYFTEGHPISNVDTLVQLATEVGLDAQEVRSALTSEAFVAEVRADIQRARQIGVRGVPFFLFEERYAISGAQPTEVFIEALERTWEAFYKLESQPN